MMAACFVFSGGGGGIRLTNPPPRSARPAFQAAARGRSGAGVLALGARPRHVPHAAVRGGWGAPLRGHAAGRPPRAPRSASAPGALGGGGASDQAGADAAPAAPGEGGSERVTERRRERTRGWDLRYTELLEYKAARGDCIVPFGYPANPALATWVGNQRQLRKRGALSAEREARLDSAGFVWEVAQHMPWEERFGELLAFKERFGHCMVQQTWEESPPLAKWVSKQRRRHKLGVLEPERVEKLEGAGFVWAVQDAEWESRLEELLGYRARYGDCMVPRGWEDNPSLSTWVMTQRALHRRGELAEARQERLEDIGFSFDGREDGVSWEVRYQQLGEFKGRFGHCTVPPRWEENPRLWNWVGAQRGAFRRGQLSAERAELLQALGAIDFAPGARQMEWAERLGELAAYKERFGDCRVPQYWDENPSLAHWVKRQRQLHKMPGELSEERALQLEGLGFEWSLQVDWGVRYEELVAYRAEHGDCLVPQKWAENPALGKWVHQQRGRGRRRLSGERRAMLEALDFAWEVSPEVEWESRVLELIAYCAAYGDCEVPRRWEDNPRLGSWVAAQHKLHRRGELSDERTRRMAEAGVVFAPTKEEAEAAAWAEWRDKLAAYKTSFGDTNVPAVWEEDPKLRNWVAKQRRLRRKGALPEVYAASLDALGFTWDFQKGPRSKPAVVSWEHRYGQLAAYQAEHGDCLVPQKWPGNPALGLWVAAQRKQFKQGKLAAERVQRLQEIGFVWERVQLMEWEVRLGELVAYKEEHGDCLVPVIYPENPQLGLWLSNQRQRYKRGELEAGRKERLNEVGVVLDGHVDRAGGRRRPSGGGEGPRPVKTSADRGRGGD